MFNVDLVRFKNNQYHVEEISDDENFVKKLKDDNAELLNEHRDLFKIFLPHRSLNLRTGYRLSIGCKYAEK